ncbi:MAG: hypothetical protein JKY65_05495 [Planctomycetes bacterium]|nr:hypothetical protein [Planctomycetota bacterium]
MGAAGATGGVGPVASSATFASVSSAVLIDLFIADYVVPADRDLLILSYGGEDGNGTLAIDGVPAYQFGGVLLEGPVPIPAGVTLSLVTQVVPRRKLRFMGVLTTEDEAVFITLTPATPYVVPAGKTLFIYTTRTPAPASGGGITELLLDGVEYQTFPNNDKRNYPSQMVIPPGVTLSVPAFILRFTGRLR